MEEIDLSELFHYFWTKKVHIFLITLLAIAAGCVYTVFIQKPEYQSYTTILLTNEEGTITNNDLNLNQNLVDTYSEIIRSKRVMKQVIQNLDLDYSVKALTEEVKVEALNDTEIIKITVTDKNAALAKNIANETADVFNKEIYNYYNIRNTGVVDEAEISINPSNVNVLKQMVIAFLIGITAGFGFVFILFYFDTTVKSAEEIEKKLELPVIGLIPHVGLGGK